MDGFHIILGLGPHGGRERSRNQRADRTKRQVFPSGKGIAAHNGFTFRLLQVQHAVLVGRHIAKYSIKPCDPLGTLGRVPNHLTRRLFFTACRRRAYDAASHRNSGLARTISNFEGAQPLLGA